MQTTKSIAKSIAVVGSGWRAFAWFTIINVMPGVTLKTVVCRNAEKAERIKSPGCPFLYSSSYNYAEIFDRKEIYAL